MVTLQYSTLKGQVQKLIKVKVTTSKANLYTNVSCHCTKFHKSDDPDFITIAATGPTRW